jgi:superfamily I DNA/RNA helicase
MKGGEANRVVLLTDMAQRTHAEMHVEPDDESRVWYVAVTRARMALEIVKPKTSRFFEFAG